LVPVRPPGRDGCRRPWWRSRQPEHAFAPNRYFQPVSSWFRSRCLVVGHQHVQPGDDLTQVGDALPQALVVVDGGGGGPDGRGPLAVFGGPPREEWVGGLQQGVARLGEQAEGGRDGDVGEDVGGALEAQPVLDQAVVAGLGQDGVDHPLVAHRPQAGPEVAEQAGVRQVPVQAQVKEEAEPEVQLGLVEDPAVGQVLVVLQVLQPEQQQRLGGRTAGRGRVRVGQDGAQAGEVEDGLDPAQVVVRGDEGLKDLLVQGGEGDVPPGLQQAYVLTEINFVA
jgi:hypothetical protein